MHIMVAILHAEYVRGFPALHCEIIITQSMPGTSGLLYTNSIASSFVSSLRTVSHRLLLDCSNSLQACRQLRCVALQRNCTSLCCSGRCHDNA